MLETGSNSKTTNGIAHRGKRTPCFPQSSLLSEPLCSCLPLPGRLDAAPRKPSKWMHPRCECLRGSEHLLTKTPWPRPKTCPQDCKL